MMKYTCFGKADSIVYIESEALLISDGQSALDLLMTVKYEKDCGRLILDQTAVCEAFFRLSSGIAGEVLQKFINYHTKLAIVGDFSKYSSQPLRDFIYECNHGNDIFFVGNLEQAVEKLTLAK